MLAIEKNSSIERVSHFSFNIYKSRFNLIIKPFLTYLEHKTFADSSFIPQTSAT